MEIEETTFEKLFHGAFTQAELRPEFDRQLLDQQFYFLVRNKIDSVDSNVIQEDTPIQVATLNGGIIPIFSSQHRIYEKNILSKDNGIVYAMKCSDIFKNFQNSTFVLNPYSEHNREFSPSYIQDILAIDTNH